MSRRGGKRRRSEHTDGDRREISRDQRLADENGKEFPTATFVREFCVRRSLVSEDDIGTSELEKVCFRYSEDARVQFKNLLDARESNEDIRGLDTEQKYSRRLRRNRRSAACSKVSDEILVIAQATMLRRLSSDTFVDLNERIRILQDDREKLLQTTAVLNEALASERNKLKELQATGQCNSTVPVHNEAGNGVQDSNAVGNGENCEIQRSLQPLPSQCVDVFGGSQSDLGEGVKTPSLEASQLWNSPEDNLILHNAPIHVATPHQQSNDNGITVPKSHPLEASKFITLMALPESSTGQCIEKFEAQPAVSNGETDVGVINGPIEVHPKEGFTNTEDAYQSAPVVSSQGCEGAQHFPGQLQVGLTEQSLDLSQPGFLAGRSTPAHTVDLESHNRQSSDVDFDFPSSQHIPTINNSEFSTSVVAPQSSKGEECNGFNAQLSCRQEETEDGYGINAIASLPIFPGDKMGNAGGLQPIPELQSNVKPISPVDDIFSENI